MSKEDVEPAMSDYLNRLHIIDLSKNRRYSLTDMASDDETHSYRSLAGTLLNLFQAVLPQPVMIAPEMQQSF